MEEIVVFGKWRLRCDLKATRKAHALIPLGSPETCGCADCRNFAAARSKAYPQEVISLFEKLGINPTHESEIYHMGRLNSGLHLYGGWLHFVGAIESEGDGVGPFDMEQGEEVPFRMFFANSQNLLPESFGRLPVVQVEFVAHIPWILAEPESA